MFMIVLCEYANEENQMVLRHTQKSIQSFQFPDVQEYVDVDVDGNGDIPYRFFLSRKARGILCPLHQPDYFVA